MFNLHLKKNLEAWLGEEVPLISRQDTHLVSVEGVTISAAHSTQISRNDGRFSFLQ